MAEEGFKRKLTAILSADVAGYSRMMRDDEDSTIRTLTNYRTAMSHLIEKFRGHLVDATGDNLLAEFTSVVDAVNCAVEIQREFAERNAELSEGRKMKFRIGVNLGDVVEENGRIYGDGINIAARMEGLATAGGICISGSVYDSVESRVGLEYEYMGEQEVKNIDKPVRAYNVLMQPKVTTTAELDGSPKPRTARNRKIAFVCTVALLVVIGVAVWQFTLYKAQPPANKVDLRKAVFPLADKPSVAVLPFENMTGDSQQQYFCDGMTEQIITGLSQGPYIYVTARTSSFAFRGKSMTAQQIADELGVRYLLEGSVQRDAEQVRVNVQLIDGGNGNHIWAERYERKYEDLFALQDEIAMGIMSFLNIKITGYAAGSLKYSRPSSLQSYEYYLKGLYYHLGRRPQDVRPARQAFEEAINLDPNFAAAHKWLGMVYLDEINFRMTKSPKKIIERAEQEAQKALAIDPDNPPYGLWSHISRFKKDFDNAILYGEKSVKQAPNNSGRYFMLGLALLTEAERFEEAVLTWETALQLAPFRPVNYVAFLAWSFVGNKQYDKAILLFKEVIERSPKSRYAFFSYLGLTAAYELNGSHEKARAAVNNIMQINPKFSLAIEEKRSVFREGVFKKTIYDAFRSAGLK
jgi:adenylate cyclase